MNRSTAYKFVLSLVVCLAVLFVCVSVSFGQAETAQISGTATDTSGGALVDAGVTATNIGTSAAVSTKTDQQGRYRISQLAVGTYDVQATLSGFQTVINKGVTLSVGGAVIVDFSLPVGKVTETVNVEAQVSRVETETSEVSTLVSPQQMRDLPLNGRNFEQLLTLSPGVSVVPPALNFVTGRLYGMQDNYSVSGMRPTGQMFLLDGTDIRDFWEHGTGSGYAATSLGVEAIAEFQVLTNTYTAQFGGNGAVVNSASRSGTNDLHGGAYEFIRNSALDARDISDQFAGLNSPPPFKRNQYGGAIGGPIKKDKLFFFANYEALRQGLESTIPGAIPMPYVAQGELPCGPPGPKVGFFGPNITNSSSATCLADFAAPGSTWAPVSGFNTGANPIEPVAPVAAGGAAAVAALTRMENIAALYSLCNGCRAIGGGTDLGGYYTIATTPNLIVNEDYILGRVDYTLSSKDSVFGRYVIDDARVQDNPRDALGIFPEKDFTRNQFVTITEKRVMSATMVNSLRFGYTRNNENSRVPLGLTSAQWTKAGLTSDPLDFVRTAYKTQEPFSNREDGTIGPSFLNGITPIGPDPNRPDTLIQSKFSGGDDVVWTHGSHSFKVGGVVTRVETNNIQPAYANGNNYYFVFGLQDFLQGIIAQAYAAPPKFGNSTRYFREIDVAPYIQDDWKVTRRLTLNFGIRYDYATNPKGWGPGGVPLTTYTGSFLPPIGPVTPGTYVPGNFATLFPAVTHVFLNNPNTANWGPRFGFAYDPFSNHKTSIRGGVGVFHDPVAARIYESGFIANPPAASFNLVASFGSGPCVPDAFATVPGYCGVAAPAPGSFAGVDYLVPHGSPYDMQYNLNIQREIAPGTVFSIGYVGSLGRHLWMQRDINPPKCNSFPNCTGVPTVANPNTGVDFSNFLAGNPAFQRINPVYGGLVTEAATSSSSYSSLQVSLHRQFARNFAGQVNYTWSHCIDDGSFATSLETFAALLTDSYNQKYDYGNCLFDQRHNLTFNGLYSLPFKGNRLVEGWQLSTLTGIHSGLPINITNNAFGGDPTNLQTQAGSRPNYSGAAGCSPNHIIDKAVPGSPGVIQWFDPTCYAPQTGGYMGNVKRNSIPGPGYIGVDFSVIKNTKLTEGTTLQFRAELFNVINHLNLGTPAGALGGGPPVFFGQVASSLGTPRQVQFAVKLDF
ncbi:MAG TPA: carboxypeptidase regulatory-like domain-containing protein [Candidatus Acidoferrales bacterium]|nr:carboxypeptidase regulatory-like domain-containing protein [Candidatus Acidoferrales bacterium]